MSTNILSWPQKSDRYAPGFHIGSADEDGTHRRDMSGWPYSVYRMATAAGVDDAVICDGIQHREDAYTIAAALESHQTRHGATEPDNPEDRGPWRYLKSPVLTPDEIDREWE